MRSPGSVAAVSAVLLAVLAGEARAQAPCEAPVITGMAAGPSTTPDVGGEPHFRVGEAGRLRVEVRGAATVDIDWGDSERETVGVRGDAVTVRHAYARAGRVQILAVARALCGAASPPGGYTVSIHPPCHRTRGRDVNLADCDDAAGDARVAFAGVSTRAAWLSGPCRDSFSNVLPKPPEPVTALPASCAAPDPRAVPGLLGVRAGRRVTIVLGAPAERVRVAVRGIGVRGRYRAARSVGGTGRVWRVRLPRTLTPAHDRLAIRARRPGAGDSWRAGIRPRG